MRKTILAVASAMALAACGGEATSQDDAPDDNTQTPADPAPSDTSETSDEVPEAEEAADTSPLDGVLSTVHADECGTLTEAGYNMLTENSYEFPEGYGSAPEPVASITVPGTGEEIEPSMIIPHPGEDRYAVWLNVEGPWLGLNVSSMSYKFLPYSDMTSSVIISFEEPVETVAAALIEAGYPVNADGSMRRVQQGVDGVMYDYHGLESDVRRVGNETEFRCDITGWDAGD